MTGVPSEADNGIDRHDIVVRELTDGELYLIVSGGGTGHELKMKVLPPAPMKDGD